MTEMKNGPVLHTDENVSQARRVSQAYGNNKMVKRTRENVLKCLREIIPNTHKIIIKSKEGLFSMHVNRKTDVSFLSDIIILYNDETDVVYNINTDAINYIEYDDGIFFFEE